MNYLQEYRSKLKTPEEAVRIVKDGDWVDYTSNLGFPPLLDEALAARRDELHDVKIRGNLIFGEQTLNVDVSAVVWPGLHFLTSIFLKLERYWTS